MSGWCSPTHPAPRPIPLALRGGDGAESGRPPPPSGWCFVDASISLQTAACCRWKDHAHVGANSGLIVSIRVSGFATRHWCDI